MMWLWLRGSGWISTPGPAVAVSVAVDGLAYLPTIAHAWRLPHDEPWRVYGLFGVGAALSLAAVALQGQMLNLTAAAYPLYLVVADLGVAALIVYRRGAPAPAPAWPGGPLPWRAVQLSDGPDGRPALVTVTPPGGPAQVCGAFRPPADEFPRPVVWPVPPEPGWPEVSRRAAVTTAVGLLAEVHH